MALNYEGSWDLSGSGIEVSGIGCYAGLGMGLGAGFRASDVFMGLGASSDDDKGN